MLLSVRQDRINLVVPDPIKVVSRLHELHVPVLELTNQAVTGVLFCAYDGFVWPCRERRILDGYEEEL